MTLFMLLKAISWLVLPPAVFILILFGTVPLIKEGKKFVAAMLVLFVGFSMYFLSIEPVKDRILMPLEYKYPFPDMKNLNCDTVVTLGGGMYLNSPDENGKPSLKPSVIKRVITAYKIWKIHKKPIILTGGRPFNNKNFISEAEVMADFLKNLGVPKRYLITESNSLNTFQNAELTKKILKKHNWKNVCLITSACHMPRAVSVFKHFKIKVIPVPTDYRTNRISYTWEFYFPQASSFEDSIAGIHEYLGILFYRIRYGIKNN